MIKSYVKTKVSHEHSTYCQIQTEIDVNKALFVPELVSLLKACFDRMPDETLKSLELFVHELKEVEEDEN
mgnify:CR=1 FL=1